MNQPKRPVKQSKAGTPGDRPAPGGRAAPKAPVPPRSKGKGSRPAGGRPRPSSARPAPAAQSPGGATTGNGTTRGVSTSTPGWERRRQQHQRRNAATIASVIIVVAVIALVIVKVATGSGSAGSTPVPAAVANQVTSVPLSDLVSAATSTKTGPASGTTVTPPGPVNPPTTLTSAGKPEVFYEGAEYCPFCAAERWPMVMALAKFGTFSHLGQTSSSSTDPTNSNTPTFSFNGSTFTSPNVVFTAVETQDRVGGKLQTPTATQKALVKKYDNTPYVSANAANSIPFVLFGGKYLVSGSEFDGAVLANDSMAQAANILTAPSSAQAAATSKLAAVSLATKATAGHLVGVICSITGDQPANVCSQVPASLKQGGQNVISGKGSDANTGSGSGKTPPGK